ncbi:MAG TPA: hypothetical protein VNQ52_04735 [Microbacteriaceae bacterium]|nr:hypothetical protein [Microbacteriaceae bacterium]
MHPSPRTLALLSITAAAAMLTLTGCGGASSPPPDQGSAVDNSSSADGNSSSDDSTGSVLLVLSGTGRYAIGTEAPYGGYQIKGEPDAVPPGCTWSIQDADGEVFVDQSNGIYAFITDVPEAVTFVTDGCPDWEQFE